MTKSLIFGVLLIVTTAAVCDAARILAVLPLMAKSHHFVMQPIIRGLAERGHDITLYTPILLGKNYTNVKQVEVHLPMEDFIKEMDFNVIRDLGGIPTFGLIKFWPLGLGAIDGFLSHPEFQNLIHSKDKYDLVIIETHFAQEALVALGHRFKAPVVSLATFSSYVFLDEFLGNPFGTAYVPGFEFPYSDDMSLLQRCHNAIRVVSILLAGHYFFIPYQESYIRQYFNYTGADLIPPLAEMLQEIALVILNTHIAIDYARPMVPNMISAAGLHIEEKRKPLPKDLKEFLDNSKHGVIYISFGSLVPAEKMPEEMLNAFVKAFGKLKQDVLWKLPLDSFPGLPKNIKLSKWLPQQDVLAHPKIKAFMTHGGLLSQEEAVYFGVPLIGVPFFGDQYMNIKRAAKDEFAVYLDSYNVTEESVTWALDEVLNNPKYKENAKLRSKIFRDHPISPAENAMYWIEYVLKYKGAPHLRTTARNLPYYKYLLIDVIAFIIVSLVLSFYVMYLAISFLWSLCSKSKKPQVKQNKKKNN